MKCYTILSQSVSKYLLLLIVMLLSFTINIKTQDLFGQLPTSTTSYVTKSKVASNGHLYVTVWGTGVFRSTDQGKTWTPINTGLTNFNLTDIEFISSGEILIATMGGGVFKTTSLSNINWIASNDGLTNLNVKSIKTYPNGWVFIGTYGSGVYVSKNKGANWTISSKGLLHKDITTLEIANNGWILAGTYGGGIFMSRDTSRTWKRQGSSRENQFINDIKRSPLDYLYAASNGRGVYISVNDGIAWTELDTFMTRPLKINPVPLPDLNATNITFNKFNSPVFGSRYGGIYAEDKVEDFSWIPTRLRGVGVNTMCQSKDSMYSFFPNFSPHSSDNVGEEWNQLPLEPFASLAKPIKVLSKKEKELVVYSGNIIKKSKDEGQTWSQGIALLSPINKIAVDSAGYYYIATEKGLYVADQNFTNINLKKCLDTNVFDVEIAPNGSIFIVTQFFKENPAPTPPTDIRQLWYSVDANIWIESNVVFDKKVPPPRDIGINYNGHIYVIAGDIVYYSISNGVLWLPTSQFPSYVASIGFLTDNTVLVGTTGSGMYKSTNGTTFALLSEYPAKAIDIIYVGINNIIYTSGMNLLIDAGFGTVEATYISTDRGESFININKDFNNEKVMSFCVNIAEDLYMTTSSGMIYRAISSKNLKTPNVLGMEDNAVDVDVDAEFKWTSVERAELYQLQISYNDDFSSQWEHVTQKDTIHNLFLAPLNNYKYYWRVRAKNHDAVSEWSPVRSFYSKLAQPELLSPSDKEINVPVYANLNWKKVEAATQYLIQISNTNDFANIEHEWISDDSLTTSPLLQGRTKYFWRVKAYNDMSTSNWSVVWSFETVFGPPELLSPLNEASGVSNTPEMRWKSAIDISEYDIQISLFQDFSEIAFSSNSIPDTSIIAESLLFDTVYYWRVRSSNNEAKSEWSLVWQFRTGYSPVELVSPNYDAVNVAINTEYLWTAHSSQNKYEIEVSKVNNFVNKVISDSIENNVTYIASNLESYHEYYWRVRVKSDFNTGVWSEIRKYKTKVGQIELRFPGNTSQNHPVSISFLWFQTKGATSYHLQIANDLLFNDLIFSQDTISKTSHLYNQLNGGSEYFWRVRAVSPEGVGDWSEVWSFRTGNDIPVLISPENGNSNIINPIKFEWAPVMGVIKYELTVSENSNFSSPIINETNIINNYYTTSELDYPKVYYWRIRAITDNGTSSWSQTWSFGTKDPLSVNNKILVEINEIYPNPTDKFVTIRLPQTISENSNLDIFDISGNKVYHKILNGINDEIKVDCSELSTGKYFVIIESADSLFNAEFMIIR